MDGTINGAASIHVKFFQNPSFCTSLREYLAKEYAVDYRIGSEIDINDETGIPIELKGADRDINHAQQYIKSLFETVKCKVYNNDNTDKKVIYWSTNIYSDSALYIIQKIFDNQKLFTVWDKTDFLSGYYMVYYFSSEHSFHVSEKQIDQIINNEIVYVQNLIISNFDRIQLNFENELNQFIDDKKKQLETLSIIYCKYPLQTELKISFFGQKNIVYAAKKQLQYLLNKHQMKTIRIELDSTQREYLMDNCVCQLRNIELKYKDDNVKIQIHEDLFYAPQYLISKIKQMINSLIFQRATISFQCIQNDDILTTKERFELEKIAQKSNCQIDKIDVETTRLSISNNRIESMQVEADDCEQFCYPISTITIHLKASRNCNIVKGENAIRDYLRKHIITTIEIDNAFDPQIWNQHMINVYYKYCIEKFVFPTISSINKQKVQEREKLQLTGSISAVNELKQRYEFMSEIIKLKSDLYHLEDPPHRSNIMILCCPDDEVFSYRLASRLIDDGYLVCVNPSNQLSSSIDKTDVILVYFTGNYLKNENSITHIKLAKTSGKKIIPISSTENINSWLDSVTIIDLYYQLFQQEIHFKLDENFGFEYDKLLVELLHYTKIGIVGQTYPILSTDSNKEDEQVDNIFHQENLQKSITIEQKHQREEIYRKTTEKMTDREKIPIDELDELIRSLTLVIEDCKSDYPSEAILETKTRTQCNLNDLSLCIKRWMDKASKGTIIRGNIPPFTLTGDFNDAPYPIMFIDKSPWWETSTIYPSFDHSPPNIYFQYPPLIIGSWFNRYQANHYYQTLINRDIRYQQEKRSRRKISKFTTELKKDQIAWDITQDKLISKEYKRRKDTSCENSIAWQRVLKRSVKLLSDIKQNKIDVKGKIGDELKTEEQIRKLNQLDDPNNNSWLTKRPSRCSPEFIQAKIQNTIQLQKFFELSM